MCYKSVGFCVTLCYSISPVLYEVGNNNNGVKYTDLIYFSTFFHFFYRFTIQGYTYTQIRLLTTESFWNNTLVSDIVIYQMKIGHR